MRALLLCSLLLAGCATDRVILLPDAQGKVGKIMVSRGSDQALLDSAYSTAEIDSLSLDAQAGEAEAVRKEYGAQLSGLPPRPVSYILYFLDDSDDLTAESSKQAPAILAEISQRPVAEVVVIGHTDRMGNQTYNDLLSVSRARAIRDQLVELGFDEKRLRFVGRGEREPLVTTADEVSEARNRRVEINVR